jgi:hypothetical protein
MARIFDVRSQEGNASGEYTIYYNEVNVSNIATISSSGNPAQDIPFSNLSSVTGLRIIVPDNTTKFIVVDENGSCSNIQKDQAPLSNSGSFCFTSNQYNGGLLGFDSTLSNLVDDQSVCQRYTAITSNIQGGFATTPLNYIDCDGNDQSHNMAPFEEFSFCASEPPAFNSNFTYTDTTPCNVHLSFSNSVLGNIPNSKIINIGGVDTPVIYDQNQDTKLYLYKALTKSPIKYELVGQGGSPYLSNGKNTLETFTSTNYQYITSVSYNIIEVPQSFGNIWISGKINLDEDTSSNISFTQLNLNVFPLAGSLLSSGGGYQSISAYNSSGDKYTDGIRLSPGRYWMSFHANQRHIVCEGTNPTPCTGSLTTYNLYYTNDSTTAPTTSSYTDLIPTEANSTFYFTKNGDNSSVTIESGKTESICADHDSITVGGKGLIKETNELCQTEEIHKLVFYTVGNKILSTPSASINIIRNDLSSPNNIVISASNVPGISLSGGRLLEYDISQYMTGSVTASMGIEKSVCIEYQI